MFFALNCICNAGERLQLPISTNIRCLIHLALGLGLLVANLEVLGALDGLQPDGLASVASQLQRDLLRRLRLPEATRASIVRFFYGPITVAAARSLLHGRCCSRLQTGKAIAARGACPNH